MELEEFIIAIYLRLEEAYDEVTGGCRIRRGGYAPALTDAEVLTIEVLARCWESCRAGTESGRSGVT